MFPGLDLLTAAGLFILTSESMTCTVPHAPRIMVTPSSAPIQYEFSLSSEELDRFQSNTVNPYAPGTDVTTGGLRHDRPQIKTEVQWGTMHDPLRDTMCFWYQSITVNIDLSPKIYVAKENDNKTCRAAILEHELKHVDVDREVINEYARTIGLAVKQAVDGVGAIGPYNRHEAEGIQKKLVEHIKAAVDSQKFLLYQEMARRQGQVDTLEEYERVNQICREAEKNDFFRN